MTTHTDELITLAQAAELLGIGYTQMYNIAMRKLSAFPKRVKRSGDRWLYRKTEFEAFDVKATGVRLGLNNRIAVKFLSMKLGN